MENEEKGMGTFLYLYSIEASAPLQQRSPSSMTWKDLIPKELVEDLNIFSCYVTHDEERLVG